ncbi:hypothetical protein ATCV1_z519L [Acanthocystis turfacea chlorella virus 1]|uniref:Uncharacterized protein z519L n=1 Tax=Chlorovirus heliozoae TaxID=322019 RepID=A7K9C9_9PHYC|nr:hypothetical protein ATCV1_z519L [Acanthocystis turfacea chlorella virus 1]ABT16653.1 hypothetical protein ATCV1_z519L [Acanthocystis turfacea chlorella virus 1]
MLVAGLPVSLYPVGHANPFPFATLFAYPHALGESGGHGPLVHCVAPSTSPQFLPVSVQPSGHTHWPPTEILVMASHLDGWTYSFAAFASSLASWVVISYISASCLRATSGGGDIIRNWIAASHTVRILGLLSKVGCVTDGLLTRLACCTVFSCRSFLKLASAAACFLRSCVIVCIALEVFVAMVSLVLL